MPPATFDELVCAGTVPRPKAIGGVTVWDRHELDASFDRLTAAEPARVEAGDPGRDEPLAGRTKVFTPRTLAKFWGCSERHVYNLCISKQLGHFKLGTKLIRIRPVDVETYQRDHPIRTIGDEISTAEAAGAPAGQNLMTGGKRRTMDEPSDDEHRTLLMRPEEVAAYLAISTRQLRKMTNDGALPYVNLGRGLKRELRRYKRTDVEAFIRDNKQTYSPPERRRQRR